MDRSFNKKQNFDVVTVAALAAAASLLQLLLMPIYCCCCPCCCCPYTAAVAALPLLLSWLILRYRSIPLNFLTRRSATDAVPEWLQCRTTYQRFKLPSDIIFELFYSLSDFSLSLDFTLNIKNYHEQLINHV